MRDLVGIRGQIDAKELRLAPRCQERYDNYIVYKLILGYHLWLSLMATRSIRIGADYALCIYTGYTVAIILVDMTFSSLEVSASFYNVYIPPILPGPDCYSVLFGCEESAEPGTAIQELLGLFAPATCLPRELLLVHK